jgi:hypothetical protein
MTRAVVFLAAAMFAASLGAVGQGNSGGPSTPQNNSDNSAPRIVTVAGCLASSATGVYRLTDAHSNTYTLAGNSDTLQGHAGQEIEITGQQTLEADTSGNNSASGHPTSPTIQVTTTKVVADHCNSSGSTQLSQPGPRMSGLPSAAHDSSTSAATGGRESGVQSLAQSEDPAVNNGQLPQTSTILPLLGLIGLGSLVAGFLARH